MSARTDTSRSLPDRQHLGAQIRDARHAIGMNQRQVAAAAGIRQCSVSYIENATRDALSSSLVDMAAAVGRFVVLAGEHHLPLLNLTAAEVDALRRAAWSWADAAADSGDHTDPHLLAALDKLTTTEEPTDA